MENVNGSGMDSVSLAEAVAAAVRAGENTLRQTVVDEVLRIDETWVSGIENYLFSIEQIAKKPKTFIREERDVVPVERARRVDGIAVRHLSAHMENIRKVGDNGYVEPSKILAKFSEQEDAIYENRFVYTLVQRLKRFIDSRYKAIKESINTFSTTDFRMESDFNLGGDKVRGEILLKVQNKEKYEAEINAGILKRLENLKARIAVIEHTELFKSLSGCKQVIPPVMKTNILTGNTDYRNCYNLWVFISGFTAMGYSVDISEKTLPFDDDYYTDLTNVMAESLEVILRNNRARSEVYDNLEKNLKKTRKYKVAKRLGYDGHMTDAYAALDEKLNQYYYEKIRELAGEIARKSTAEDVAGVENINADFKRFFKGLCKINNEMYLDIMRVSEENVAWINKAEKITERRRAIAKQREVCKKYSLLTKLKQEELALFKNKEKTQYEKLKKMEDALEKKRLTAQLKREAEIRTAKEERERQLALEREAARKKREEERAAERKRKVAEAEKLRKKIQAERFKERKRAALLREREKLKKKREEEREKEAQRKALEKQRAKEELAKRRAEEKAKLAEKRAEERQRAREELAEKRMEEKAALELEKTAVRKQPEKKIGDRESREDKIKRLEEEHLRELATAEAAEKLEKQKWDEEVRLLREVNAGLNEEEIEKLIAVASAARKRQLTRKAAERRASERRIAERIKAEKAKIEGKGRKGRRRED